MMSDALPVLSTDALTAAVTSLLQIPLPDNDQIAETTIEGKTTYERRREKTGFLHMRKQRRRSASR